MRQKRATRTILSIAIATTVALTLSAGLVGAVPEGDHDSNSGDTQEVKVCHVPAGNPSNAQLVTVSEQSWENGHSKHGNDIRMDQHPPHHPDHQHNAETMCEHHGEHIA
jgi:hypothetical protein